MAECTQGSSAGKENECCGEAAEELGDGGVQDFAHRATAAARWVWRAPRRWSLRRTRSP